MATTLHVLTSKVRPIAQFGFLVAPGQHTDSSVLDEVHLTSDCALANDEVRGLKHFKAELGQHGGHKVGISVGEKWHVCHQAAAVEADDFLDRGREKRCNERGRVTDSLGDRTFVVCQYVWASVNLLPL